MTVLRNDGRWGASNAAYSRGRVLYDKRDPPPGAAWIDYGLLAFTADALREGDETDVADVLARISRAGGLAGPPGAPSLLRDRHARRARRDRALPGARGRPDLGAAHPGSG